MRIFITITGIFEQIYKYLYYTNMYFITIRGPKIFTGKKENTAHSIYFLFLLFFIIYFYVPSNSLHLFFPPLSFLFYK